MHVGMRGMESFAIQRNIWRSFIIRHHRIADNSLASFFFVQAARKLYAIKLRHHRFEPASKSLRIFILVSAFICEQPAQRPMMDIEKGTDLQRTATEQQDQVVGGESGKKGEYAENLLPRENKPTEQQATRPAPGFRKAGGVWGVNHCKTKFGTISSRINANAQSFLSADTQACDRYKRS